MSTYNSFEWRNENTLAGYPLALETEYSALLVDAAFVQFDNFVPVLNSVRVDSDSLVLAITFDYGQHAAIIYPKSSYLQGEDSQHLRIFQPSNNRYLGVVCFGDGASDLWNSTVGSLIKFDTPFHSSVVRSIPKQHAVYTFDGNYGEVTLGREASDTAIFYNTSKANGFNSITINAVGGHSTNTTTIKGEPSPGFQGLRKINLVSPSANNINIVPNDVIKLTALSAAALSVDLATGSPAASFNFPSLTS